MSGFRRKTESGTLTPVTPIFWSSSLVGSLKKSCQRTSLAMKRCICRARSDPAASAFFELAVDWNASLIPRSPFDRSSNASSMWESWSRRCPGGSRLRALFVIWSCCPARPASSLSTSDSFVPREVRSVLNWRPSRWDWFA